jgi:beta-lactamase class A
MNHIKRFSFCLLLPVLFIAWKAGNHLPVWADGPASRPSAQAQSIEPETWTYTTQADWMAGRRDHLDVRTLDARGLVYALDRDPRGAMRLRSQPGTWSEHPENPLIEPGAPGAWDDAVISEAKVIYDGQRFYMWYAGRRRDPEGLKTPVDVGYATSPDGVHWTKSTANPVLGRGPRGDYDENLISAPYVLYDGGQFHMWYSAANYAGKWSIDYATSPDGIEWAKYGDNPLFAAAGTGRWDAVYVAEPCVLYNGSFFQMWYNGASRVTETLLGYAVSPDGVHWTPFQEDQPVLDVGPRDAWDDFAVARAHVLYDGEQYKMWYEGHDGSTWRIGYATSPDGIRWQRPTDHPILDLGPAGAWDSQVVSEPYVLFDGRTYWLWYSGYDGDLYRVGLATAPAVYDAYGTFTSLPIEAVQPVQWGTLACDLALPEGTGVQFELATSEDGQGWGPWTLTASGWVSGSNRVDLTRLGLAPSRFVRYRATLTTTDPRVSPLIREVAIAEAVPDFDIALREGALPSAQTITLQAGQTVELTVSLEPVCGFSAPVELDAGDLPAGLEAEWASRSLAPPGSTVLTLKAGQAASSSTVPLAIQGRSGDLAHTVTVTLRLVQAPPTVTPTPTATRAPTSTPLPTPSPTPTPTPLPPPPPLPPANPGALWLGIGLAGGGVLSAGVWLLLVLFTRRQARHTWRQVYPSRQRPWWRHWIWAILFVALAAVGLYQSWRYVQARRAAWEAYQSRIRPGVHVSGMAGSPTPLPPSVTPEDQGELYVAGIDVSGMTADQVRQAVETRVIAPYRRTLTVHYLNRTRPLDTASLDLRTNLDEIIAQAVAVGAGENTEQAFGQFLLRNPEPVDVSLTLTYTFNYDLLRPWVDEIAAEVEKPVVEHAFDERSLTFTRGQTGAHLEVEEALRRLQAAVPDLAIDEVELPLTYTPPREWSDEELAQMLSRAAAGWNEPPLPASSEQITIPFDEERWIGPASPAADWRPTRPMTGYTFLPGRMGWTLDVPAARQAISTALEAGAPQATARVFTDVMPASLTLTDVKPLLLEIAGHFDGLTGFYVQDLTSGDEIRYNTYVTASGMSMIKVAIMATAYRTITQPFDAPLQDAMSQMIAHSINERANDVILAIGQGDFQEGLRRVNDTLDALGMNQTYISRGYLGGVSRSYEPIPIRERPPVDVPPDEQLDLWPDTAMQTSLSDQAILFEALYRGAQGEGRLLEAFPNLTPEDCQEMLDLLKTNPTRTFLGPGFGPDVPMAHKNGFGGGSGTDERMNVGIIWPPGGRPYLVGLYQWDKVDWIHWLRVWPQQIEFSTTLYSYFTMPPPLPAPPKPG